MSDIVERAKAAHARRWEQPGGTYDQPAPRGVVELGDWASEELPELVAELEAAQNHIEALKVGQDNSGVLLAKAAEQYDALVAENERLREHLGNIPSAIEAYVGSEMDGYSYHGDGSAIEALKHLRKNAEGIVAYAATRRAADA